MRIFIITGTYPTKMNKQAGGFVKDQAQALAQAGNEVVVLAVQGMNWRRWKEIKGTKIIKTIDKDITIYDLRYQGIAQSRIPRIAIYSFNKKLIKIFNKAIKENGVPDILYAHFSFLSGFGASIIAKKHNIPLLVLEHHSLFLKKHINSYIVKVLKQTIESSADFMCVSHSLKNSIKGLTNTSKSISVLPNILGSKFRYKPNIRKANFIFFSAGNLVKGKAFDILIESFIKAFSKNENIKLIIGGNGPEKSKLIKMITKNGRENQIKLLGRLDRDAMIENYELCDCFVLASRRETFGIAYREAMAIGRPVISTRNGGIEECWRDTFGLLTEIDDINGLSNALKIMRKQYNSYDGKQISKFVLEKYSEDTIINQLEKKLEKIKTISK